jgi:hypothetical protein
MLWGTGQDHVPTWSSNAKAAIASGSGHLLSFNEPDNTGQANLDPATAASAHIQYMNPFAGQAQIGSPAITNSNIAVQSVDWLNGFMSACAGQCAIDFVACHWYGPPDPSNLLDFVQSVYNAVKKPVWLTEFASISGSDDDINTFVQSVMKSLDSDPTYSFVQRYAYFMVGSQSQPNLNLLGTGSTPNVFGQSFAYS